MIRYRDERKLLRETNLLKEIDNRSITMVENFKGGDGLLSFDSAAPVESDNRAFARWAATHGADSEHMMRHVPADPSPTRLQVLSFFVITHGHLLSGGTNVQSL